MGDRRQIQCLIFCACTGACTCGMIVTLAYSTNDVALCGGREVNMADPSTMIASVSGSMSGITTFDWRISVR